MGVIVRAVQDAIMQDGRSSYAIAKASGIDRAQLARFVAGKGGVSSAALERLFAVIGITLTVRNVPAQERITPQCAPITKPVTREAITPKLLSRPQLSPRDKAKLGL